MDWWKDLFNEDYLKQYDRYFSPKRDRKEVRIITKTLQLNKGDKILDLGCGQGRIAIELAKRGYDVTGLDYSRYLLDIAKKRAKQEKVNVNFVRSDMRRMAYDEAFGAVVCWYTTFGYFNDRDNALIIKRASKALKKDGKFLIDIWNKEWYLKNRNTATVPSRTWYDYKDFIVLESHEYDKRKSRDNCKRIFLHGAKRREYNWSVRVYSLPEMKSIFSKTGLKILKVYGDYNLSKFTNKQGRMVIVAQKKYN